jgi:group I intron endonuclease
MEDTNQRADKRKYHYIYKTTCLITGRYYIGMHSTNNLADGYYGSGKRLRYSINKHGKENHKVEIIEFLPDRKSLSSREKEIVNETLLKDRQILNLMIGGGTGWEYVNSVGLNSRLGKKHTEEAKLKMASFKGRTHTEEAKLKISKKIKDCVNFSKRVSEKLTGRKLSSEHKKNISLAIKQQNRKRRDNNIKISCNAGEKNPCFGLSYIYNLELKQSIRVKREDLSKWIEKGWIKGRKIKF